jgi:hypothetical protein
MDQVELEKSSDGGIESKKVEVPRTEHGFGNTILLEFYKKCLVVNGGFAVHQCPDPGPGYEQFNRAGLRLDIETLLPGELQKNLDYQWFVDRGGFDAPIKCPPHDSYKLHLSLDMMVDQLGENRRIEVIDCDEQNDEMDWDLGRLSKYMKLQPFQRTRVTTFVFFPKFLNF